MRELSKPNIRIFKPVLSNTPEGVLLKWCFGRFEKQESEVVAGYDAAIRVLQEAGFTKRHEPEKPFDKSELEYTLWELVYRGYGVALGELSFCLKSPQVAIALVREEPGPTPNKSDVDKTGVSNEQHHHTYSEVKLQQFSTIRVDTLVGLVVYCVFFVDNPSESRERTMSLSRLKHLMEERVTDYSNAYLLGQLKFLANSYGYGLVLYGEGNVLYTAQDFRLTAPRPVSELLTGEVPKPSLSVPKAEPVPEKVEEITDLQALGTVRYKRLIRGFSTTAMSTIATSDKPDVNKFRKLLNRFADEGRTILREHQIPEDAPFGRTCGYRTTGVKATMAEDLMADICGLMIAVEEWLSAEDNTVLAAENVIRSGLLPALENLERIRQDSWANDPRNPANEGTGK